MPRNTFEYVIVNSSTESARFTRSCASLSSGSSFALTKSRAKYNAPGEE